MKKPKTLNLVTEATILSIQRLRAKGYPWYSIASRHSITADQARAIAEGKIKVGDFV